MRRSISCSAALALALAVALAVIAVAPAAGAQDAQTQAMGRALFNEGIALYNEGKYAEACPKFEASLKHYPGIGTRGKLAECYEKVGRFVSSWATYREVATLAKRTGDVAREQIASERAKRLEPKLSYVTISVSASNDAPGLVVKQNGREVDRSKFGAAEPVDAGTLAFDVSANGRKPMHAELVVTPGQSARFDVPMLDLVLLPRATAIETEPPHHEEERSAWRKPVGLVIAGVGVAGIAVGSYFGLSARSTYDAPFDDGRCDRATKQCDASGQAEVDDAKSQALVSTVLFIAGGALAVGGAVLFLTAPSPRRAVRVSPVMYAGGGGLVLGGSL